MVAPAKPEPEHVSVMVSEVLVALELKPGSVVVDGTLGLGGHAKQICSGITPGGTLIGFDWDDSMMAIARERLKGVEGVEVRYVRADYREIPEHVDAADGILIDLGLNNAQIMDPERGISFLHEAPLDMRMDRSQGETAAQLLNRWTERQIENVLREYSDEKWSRRIAQKVVERRKVQPLKTTNDLVECVLAAIPVAARDKRIHPATRTFQAVRCATTGELEDLEEAMMDIARVLKPGGRMVTLAYHSGEDRAVKNAFKALAEEDFEILTKKPLVPTDEEVKRNSKSRSAKLRALKRKEQ